MKVVILAGGFGTRISEESQFKPKPMVEIGGMPILWHIMKLYSYYGFNDFIICAGYKQEYIKKWFKDYSLILNDVTFDFKNNNIDIHTNSSSSWKVTVVDTGLNTQTGGRIKRIKKFLKPGEQFMVTYGDAVGDIDINSLLEYHKNSGTIGTISVYNFGQNKGVVELKDGRVNAFREKSNVDGDLINIGFMVFEYSFFDCIENDNTILEKEPMQKLISTNNLSAFLHKGYWQCMDTLREKEKIEKIWIEGNAPWKKW